MGAVKGSKRLIKTWSIAAETLAASLPCTLRASQYAAMHHRDVVRLRGGRPLSRGVDGCVEGRCHGGPAALLCAGGLRLRCVWAGRGGAGWGGPWV